MDTTAGWRRRGSAGGALRRPGAASSLSKETMLKKTPTAISQQRGGSTRSSRPPNQANANPSKSIHNGKETAPSRWKEMRQSVRIKATLETPQNQQGTARIADLCPEDREKVSKLVQRIVEVGTLQEEGDKEFQRQREALEAEVLELRDQVKRDVEEIEQLSEALHSATMKAQMFEERVEVLEESTDAETRSRLEAEQTLDLLKLEVDKLRALVRKQQHEVGVKSKEQQDEFENELRCVNLQLKETQELLIQERHERVLEKQKVLNERLERSSKEGTTVDLVASKQNAVATPPPSVPRLDASSFLNTSVELPEKIKEIIEDWKARMEEALAGTTGTTEIAKPTGQQTTHVDSPTSAVSIACQTDATAAFPSMERGERGNSHSKHHGKKAATPAIHRHQPQKASNFDKYISAGDSNSSRSSDSHRDTEREGEDEIQNLDLPKLQGEDSSEHASLATSQSLRSSTSRHSSSSQKERQQRVVPNPIMKYQRRKHSRKLPPAQGGESEADISNFPDISLLNVMNGNQQSRQRGLRHGNAIIGGVYEASLFDVVDAIENAQQEPPSDRFHFQEQCPEPVETKSPSTRIENLRRHIEARERTLHQRYDDQAHLIGNDAAPSSAMDGLAVFDEVKDLYAEDLFTSRRWGHSLQLLNNFTRLGLP